MTARGLIKMKASVLCVGIAVALCLAPSLTAEAQPAGKVYRIGLLSSGVPPSAEARSPFLLEARELGWVVGQKVIVEERWAEGKLERLPQFAAELVSARVDVIVALGGAATAAAKQATQTIPIVFVARFPVEMGLVKSLARPGGNLTGIALHVPYSKTVDLLHEILPRATRVAYLTDPASFVPPNLKRHEHFEARALMLNVKLQRVPVRASEDVETAFSDSGGAGRRRHWRTM
jgi:putative tryptophan/tyrosine transport system substrate-binding protein